MEYVPALHDSHQPAPVVNELYLPASHVVHSHGNGV